MIITKSPLRLSLGGGGTDLPSYYQQFEGELISAAINKYVYVVLQTNYINQMLLRYSKIESVNHIKEINHPTLRETLREFGYSNEKIEITSFADIPAGTGLGSSGSFLTALIKALKTKNKVSSSPKEIAEMACKIEIEILQEPIGKQDQYIAAFGGITQMKFHTNGDVTVSPVKLSDKTRELMHDHLLIFYSGTKRRSSDILRDHDQKCKNLDATIIKNLDQIKIIGQASLQALKDGDLNQFGKLLHEHWLIKRKRSDRMSTSKIDDLYDYALKNGATGGKIIGAGGGGFLMVYTPEPALTRKAMQTININELRYRIEYEGTSVLINDEEP